MGDPMSDDLPTWLPAEAGRRLMLEKDEVLFATDDPAHRIFFVQKGRVRLVRHAIDGVMVTLHVAGPGDMFAEASLFANTYHCDAVADQSSLLLAFDKERLLTALTSSRTDALKWIRHLSKQVQSLRAQAALLSLNGARDRVLGYLRLRCSDGSTLTIDRPWTVIASELGLSHEAIYRTLARLEKDGVIARDRERSTIELRSDRSR